jgi:hypothetical protein
MPRTISQQVTERSVAIVLAAAICLILVDLRLWMRYDTAIKTMKGQ